MQSQLIVKNFGPIKHVDLDLRNVNVFIGPQASGKSALAKLFTIFKAPRRFVKNGNGNVNNTFEAFLEVLGEYNINSFLKPDTEIDFDSELHSLSYKNSAISYEPKLLKKIVELHTLSNNFDENRIEIKERISELFKTFFQFKFKSGKLFEQKDNIPLSKLFQGIEEYPSFINLNKETFSLLVAIISNIEVHLSTNASLYIPSERNFISIIKNSSLNLILHNVPIPKHILLFGAELEKSSIKRIDLGFILKDLVYENVNGEERIFTNDKNSVKLSEAASGIQSVIPILIPMHSRGDSSYQQSFVIEEPELNLFPTAQYELIKYLEKNRPDPGQYEDTGAIHTYTTHSPYIISALNNLLYAHKVFNKLTDNIIISDNNWEEYWDIYMKVVNIVSTVVYPERFTAYQIQDGTATSIFDRETGLIIDNFIDEASDKMADDFDALMELMKQ